MHETVPGRGKGVSPAEFKIKLRNYDVEDQRFIKLVHFGVGIISGAVQYQCLWFWPID